VVASEVDEVLQCRGAEMKVGLGQIDKKSGRWWCSLRRGSAVACLWVSGEVGSAPMTDGGRTVEGCREEGSGSLCAV
jgi:hypothetical protein